MSGKATGVWAALFAASAGCVVAFSIHGDRAIRRVEVQRLLARAEDLLGARRVDEAIPLLTRAVHVQPDHLPARRLLVHTLLRAGRFVEASERAGAGPAYVRAEDLHAARMLVGEIRREVGRGDVTAYADETGGCIR